MTDSHLPPIRLDPRPWPINDDPDRLGRVDFDDDESATVLSLYAERRADGAHALHVELIAGNDNTIVFVDGVPYAPTDTINQKESA